MQAAYEAIDVWDFFFLSVVPNLCTFLLDEHREEGSGVLMPLPAAYDEQAPPYIDQTLMPFDHLVRLTAMTIVQDEYLDPQEDATKRVELAQLTYTEVLVRFLNAWSSLWNSLQEDSDSEVVVEEEEEEVEDDVEENSDMEEDMRELHL
jgi:hypothetical protein